VRVRGSISTKLAIASRVFNVRCSAGRGRTADMTNEDCTA
jgi:hypothetical protein